MTPSRCRSGPTGSTTPRMAATLTHDAGLVALAAGRYAEAADLLRRALDAGADVSRVAAGLTRAEALALAGDPDGATAQLRAALLEPVGPGRPALGAGAAGRLGAGPGRARPRRRRPRPGGGWTSRPAAWRARRGHAPTRRPARLPRQPRRPRPPAGRRPGRARPRARPDRERTPSSSTPNRAGEVTRCPTFTLTTHSRRPRRGGLEAAPRPGPLPRVVGGHRDGRGRAAPGRDGDYTMWPDGYPDFPMGQRLEEASGPRHDLVPGLRPDVRLAAARGRRRHRHRRPRRAARTARRTGCRSSDSS